MVLHLQRLHPLDRGTGGFYLTGDNSKLYLVTARHVVFKPNPANNDTYERKFSSQPRVNVTLFGTAAFNSYVEWIKLAIGGKSIAVEFRERHAEEAVEGRDGMDAKDSALEHADAEGLVKEAKDAIWLSKKLYEDVEKGWANIDNRVLSHVNFSPAIKPGVGSNRYTETTLSSKSTNPRWILPTSLATPSISVPRSRPTSSLV